MKPKEIWEYIWHKPNPLLQIFYLTMICGGYSIFIVTALPRFEECGLSSIHTYTTAIVIITTLHSFIAASTRPSGTLQTNTLACFDKYDYDNVLYTKRLCSTCKVQKLARSKHCTLCNVCVPRFDHHCIWLNCCIGELNHSIFLRFLLMNAIVAIYGTYLLSTLLTSEYNRLLLEPFVHPTSMEEIQGDRVIAFRFLLYKEQANIILFSLCAVLGSVYLVFAGWHFGLVLKNITTNEYYKRKALTSPLPNPYALGSMYSNFMEIMHPRAYRRYSPPHTTGGNKKRD